MDIKTELQAHTNKAIESRSSRRVKDMPSPKENWLLGSLGKFPLERIHDYLYKNAKDLGGIYKMSLLGQPMVIVSDPSTVLELLKNRPKHFKRNPRVAEVVTEMFPADEYIKKNDTNVFIAEGDDWSKQRKLMNPAFRTSQIKRFYASIYVTTQRLVNIISKENDEFDFQKLIQKYTTDVTCQLSFGSDINTLENKNSTLQENLSLIFPMMFSRALSPFPYWRYFKLKKDKELDKAINFVKPQIKKFISDARDKIKNKSEADNILEALLMSKDEHGNSFTDGQILNNVMTLLLAGEDSTANTIAWTIEYLADMPNLQDEIYLEIKNNYPTSGKISWNDLDKFPLTFAAAQESMRLKPVAPMTPLENINDEVILGYFIKKGTSITALLSSESFNEELFPNPEAFSPNRWINMSSESRKVIDKSLMPFGGGARMCPGRQLSFIEIKLSLIEILYRFKFERAEKESKTKEKMLFTLVPENLMIKVTHRL